MKTPGNDHGRVRKEIVSAVDIYPTLMELCGLEMPYKGDGDSFAKLLKQDKSNSWINAAISYFNKGISIRSARYRYTQYFRNAMPTIELYDHLKDPLETKNIAAGSPKVIEEIQSKWKTAILKAGKMYRDE